MYYNNGINNQDKKPTPIDDNGRVIILTVLATLAVLALVFAAFWFGQSSARRTSSSSSQNVSSSVASVSSSSTSFSTSSSASSSIATSSSSSASATLTTYADSNFTNFSLKYDATWTLTTSNVSSDGVFVRKDVVLVKNGNGSRLTISLDNAGHGIGGFCLSEDQIVDIGGDWSRVRVDGVRYFNRTASFDKTPPFVQPTIEGPACPSGTLATGSAYIDIPDTALTQAHIDGIKLELVGEDRAIADSIVKSINY